MTGTCQFSFGELSGAAAWSYDGSSLMVAPEGAGPLTIAVKELAGISGDDYTVVVAVPGATDAAGMAGVAELTLARLGHDGPTLREALWRDWLGARTDVLRLGGSGEGWHVLGQVSGQGDVPETFSALLFQDVLVVARAGRDLEPVFIALLDRATFDEAAYSVQMEEWPGRRLTVSKLAKQTDEFVKRLEADRALLAQEAAATLAATVPGLPVEGRGALAASWMPGRLMQVTHMESLCLGFSDAFGASWLATTLRHEEGLHLLDWASPSGTWLGCTREKGDSTSAADDSGDEAAAARPLWLLAGKGGTWFLEPLSIEDHATYCFKGGEEVPALVSRLLCAPQFSKEALYSPLKELTGDAAELAIPAAHLDFLVQLRTRFHARVIHQSFESWRQEVEGLSRPA